MKQQRKSKRFSLYQKQVSFRRLTFEALPEMWSFQILTTLLMAVPASILSKLITWTAESAGGAMTTANAGELLLNWRTPVLLLLGGLLLFWYIVWEIFAQVHMHEDVLNGCRAGILQEVHKGIRSFRRFLSPAGILILLYIFIVVPLCGIGFSISLSRTFYIPNFIMDAIHSTPLYAVAYTVLMAALAVIGWHSIFSVHAMLIDGMTPSEARKESRRLLKAHGREFIPGMIKHILFVFAILVAAYFLFNALPYAGLERMGEELPKGYNADILQLADFSFSDEMDAETKMNPAVEPGTGTEAENAAAVIFYRFLCCLTILMGKYLDSVAILLGGSYLLLRFTRYYLEFTRGACTSWTERPRKSRYGWKFLMMIAVFILIFLTSILLGLFYHQVFERPEPVKIIAHRAGGTEASENSIEGLYAAIEYGCYGSEIDVQRTKDGYYIINHDSDFKRLTGTARSPRDMTMEEIRTLRIKDTTGNGAELPVATLEEMLDAIRGKGKLFIELKGSTADRQMVDDLARIIREKDCIQDVALISLDYGIIDYAETNYPEFETGTLFFAGIGNVARLNCDLLIMEEQIASNLRVEQVHNAGKQAIVWTVNTPESMYRFLDSNVDAIITDEIQMAEETQATLNARSDLQIIQDKITNVWE